MKIKSRFPVLSATVLCLLPLASHGATDACPYEGLSTEHCKRVAAVTQRWNSPPLSSIVLAGVPAAAPATDVRPNAELDAANAQARIKDEQAGPCRYDEGEGRVEITPKAFELSNAALAQCLSAAYAQARYYSIEGQWLTHLGAHEAWVVKKGLITKVGVDKKIETAAARMLWASFAARELLDAVSGDSGENRENGDGGRALASAAELPRSSPDAQVRQFLGLH